MLYLVCHLIIILVIFQFCQMFKHDTFNIIIGLRLIAPSILWMIFI
nr:MAG TPA: hypothetical protein [Caudoviricetes sp.]